MLNNNLFGVFLNEKRQQKDLSIRELANNVGVSHTYLSLIEKGAKPPPSDILIIKIADALCLDDEAKVQFYNIAAESKSLHNNNFSIPADIAKYISETSRACDFIRQANRLGYSNDFWNRILQSLKKENMSQ